MPLTPYYDHAGIAIYHGDCLEILPQLGQVHAVVTDPPYGITYCDWDCNINFARLWPCLWDVLPHRGAVVMMACQPFTSLATSSQLANFRYDWLWLKDGGGNFIQSGIRPIRVHESVLIFARAGPDYFPIMTARQNPEVCYRNSAVSAAHANGWVKRNTPKIRTERFPTTLLRFNRETGLHPTQKPLGLAAYLIQTYTMPSQAVLDPYMGSGTTLRAAKDLGRKAIGIEIVERYCEIAAKRLAQEVLPL